MADANPKPKQAESEQDMSMEEILQSIRRIIAEEGEEAKTEDAPKANGHAPAPTAAETGSGSDVLELTDMIQEDGSVENIAPPAPDESVGVDVLASIDEALAVPKAEEPAIPELVAPEPVMPEPVKAGEAPPHAPATFAEALEHGSPLLSDEAAAASAALLKKITPRDREAPMSQAEPFMPFRSGNTVEDLVIEMLRPMLKHWLDTHLPVIVEDIVEREVKRLSSGI